MLISLTKPCLATLCAYKVHTNSGQGEVVAVPMLTNHILATLCAYKVRTNL